MKLCSFILIFSFLSHHHPSISTLFKHIVGTLEEEVMEWKAEIICYTSSFLENFKL